MPHDAWRVTLPHVIDLYLDNVSSISQEVLQVWFRPNPATVCNDGETTGNTATQLQVEFKPGELVVLNASTRPSRTTTNCDSVGDIVTNNIFFSAICASPPTSLMVTVGGTQVAANWTNTPDGGVGLYHGSAAYGDLRGNVDVTVSTSSGSMSVSNGEITDVCTANLMNWNAWTGSATGAGVHASTPRLDNDVCIHGTGIGPFDQLCQWGCGIGYASFLFVVLSVSSTAMRRG